MGLYVQPPPGGTADPVRVRAGDGPRSLTAAQIRDTTRLLRPTGSLRMVDSRNGGGAYSRRSNSPRAKDFDCGGCELALLGLTMCPMRAEPPYDFPRGVAAAIFHGNLP